MSRKESLLLAGVLTTTVLAYLPGLGGGFVYDDQFQVLRNPTLGSLAHLPRVFHESVWQFMSARPGAAVGPYYRPLFNAALILEAQLFGLEPRGWHVVSLLLHLCATWLIYRLARRWAIPRAPAAVAALLFGLHPVHVESVAWVSGLPDLLAAVFLLAAALAYERGRTEPGARARPLVLGVTCAALAALSKETAVAFPLFLLVREGLDRSPAETSRGRLRRVAARTAPYFGTVLLYLWARYAVLGSMSFTHPHAAEVGWRSAALTLPWAAAYYGRLLVLPYALAASYPVSYLSTAADPRFWANGSLLAGVFGAMARAVRRSPRGQWALAWMAFLLLPAFNLRALNPLESLVHDRYLYIPSIGLALLLALSLEALASRTAPARRRGLYALAALAAVACFVLTARQCRIWRHDDALVEAALRSNPGSPFFHNYRGAQHFLRGQMGAAEAAYREALRLRPDYADAHSNLADALMRQRRLAEAEAHYRRAIAEGIGYTNTHFNLALALIHQNKLDEAEAELRHALTLERRNAQGWYNLGWILQRQQRWPEAEEAYRSALRQQPYMREARINLGILLRARGQPAAAAQLLRPGFEAESTGESQRSSQSQK